MKKENRHQVILHNVSIHNRVLLSDLSQLLNVSIDTVRRDVVELHIQGKLKKVHGGAIANGFQFKQNVSNDEIYAAECKHIIAEKAVQLIKNDQVILISGGTTNLELVKRLPLKLRATFFTPSLPIALELMSHPTVEVILIGGKLSKDSQVSMGGYAINMLSDIKADLCFLGTGYMDTSNGLTEFDWEVVQIKKAMIRSSKKVISLTISEKLNSHQKYKICQLQEINTLITELDGDNELLTPYKRMINTIL
ncbi:MAG: DeoR family transcriptional regulator [Thalassobius sp.]|nr:DeoR family transcriptional regulator [Thalassovita sp.]